VTDSARRDPPAPTEHTTAVRRYEAVAAGFTARLAGVAADRWGDPSPCAEWSARDVAAHVVRTHRTVLARLDGTEPEEVDAEGDLAGQWKAATAAIVAALSDPERAETVIGGMFGEQTFESLVERLVATDTLVHTWDLARATGQDERLDEEAVSRAEAFLTPLDEAIRRPGGFAPKITPAPDADRQTRFLNFCGRQP
jgi:uncharacterized protein (TIGR03086 family)